MMCSLNDCLRRPGRLDKSKLSEGIAVKLFENMAPISLILSQEHNLDPPSFNCAIFFGKSQIVLEN